MTDFAAAVVTVLVVVTLLGTSVVAASPRASLRVALAWLAGFGASVAALVAVQRAGWLPW